MAVLAFINMTYNLIYKNMNETLLYVMKKVAQRIYPLGWVRYRILRCSFIYDKWVLRANKANNKEKISYVFHRIKIKF